MGGMKRDDRHPKPPGSGNYDVGNGKPPVHTRFHKGQSGKPRSSIPKRPPTERAMTMFLTAKDSFGPKAQ
jgi:hypothetical protein